MIITMIAAIMMNRKEIRLYAGKGSIQRSGRICSESGEVLFGGPGIHTAIMLFSYNCLLFSDWFDSPPDPVKDRD